MESVLKILNELAVGYGMDVVRNAALKFTQTDAPKKVKKERKPRGKSSWNLEVDKVLEEMKAVDSKVTYKMAYAEASRRKREGSPEAQAKYDAYRKKMDEKRAAKTNATPAAAPVTVVAASVADAVAASPDISLPTCPSCKDTVPSTGDAGGDGSHRACIFNGPWETVEDWENALVPAVAAPAVPLPKKRGRPSKV